MVGNSLANKLHTVSITSMFSGADPGGPPQAGPCGADPGEPPRAGPCGADPGGPPQAGPCGADPAAGRPMLRAGQLACFARAKKAGRPDVSNDDLRRMGMVARQSEPKRFPDEWLLVNYY